MRVMRAAALAVLALGVAVGASAQSATTGQIRGQVLTADGERLRGAAVTATNVETGQVRSTLTNTDGAYLLLLLPPGTYAVDVEFIGYQSASADEVRVALGSTATANFSLETQAVEIEGVRVTANRAQVDVSDASVMQLVSEEEIQGLPAPGRDFTDFIQLSGLVAPDPAETTGGQFSIAGQRASQTNLQIDGVDANNAFFGENRGGSRIPFVFSLESIKEFQVIANGFDVEYGSYSGGIVNVITRGGTNEFRGSAYANYQSDALTGNKFSDYETVEDGLEVEDFEVMQVAGSASGPLIEDKAFFLLSLDGQRRREPQLSITQQEFADSLPVVAAEVGEFFEILENQYGVANPESGYGSFQTTNDVVTLFGRVDWNLTDAHRLSARHNFAYYSNDNEWNPNFDFIYGQSRAEEYQAISNSFVTELQSVFGQRTFNVARFQYSDEARPRTGKDLRPALEVNLSEGERIAYGGTFAAFQNDLEERKLQFINNFTHVRGDHTMKVGVNVIQTNILNQFILEGAGEYSFADIDAFRNMQPTSFTRNIREGGGIPLSEFGVLEWGVYGQDEWRVTPRLTATLGLRYDVQSFLDDPERVLEAERAFGVQTGIAPTDNDNISPRLALAYDLAGNGSSVLRGGVGYFYGRVPYVLGGNVQSTVRPVVEVSCAGDPGDPDAPPSPADYGDWGTFGNENPNGCAGATEASGIPEYTFWNEDFEFPETLKANVGYETEVGERTRLSLDLLFSQSTKLYTVRNLNMRDVQLTLDAEGGRRVFQPEAVFDPSVTDEVTTEQRTRRNLELGNVYVNYNDGRARSLVATTEIVHNLTDDVQARGSYTYTRAEDNSSYSCCTAQAGFTNPRVGAFGPNDIGGIGDTQKAWGPSDFARDHTFILSLNTPLLFGIEMGAFWRLQSGRPWTPEARGDLNGDGVLFNDRPYVFAADELPVDPDLTTEEADEVRATYQRILDQNECVGEYVGQIIPRNTCRYPWYNRLDMRINRSFGTFEGQRAELQVDLFNVLNGINSEWGNFVGVFSSDRNLLLPQGYDEATNQSFYDVPSTFGRTRAIGDNLQLQFQARIGFKYYF